MNAVDFEKTLWAAADSLRGNIDASEYKHVILGLIFLKYIGDKFEEKYEKLLEEGEGFEDDRDEYIAEGIFYVPPSARWKEIALVSKEETIGKKIDEAMIAIEKENPSLKNILPKSFGRTELDKRRLGEIVDSFTNLDTSGAKGDFLGNAYEYCLTKFAEQEGKRGGEFYTPQCIVKTIVEILKPYRGRIYDPACGSGGMFIQSEKFVKEHQGNRYDISVYGQESNPTTWKMCKMNLAIRGIESDLGDSNADSFTNDKHKNLKANYIMANPPFNLNWARNEVEGDVRFKYGMPPAANANYAWLQHMVHHLSEDGKMGVVLANGSLSTNTSGEGEIRKKMVEDDLIDVIVTLPTQLFYTTQIPVSLWFISKPLAKKHKEKILFIDARNLGEMESRSLKVLTDNDIKLIAETVSNWQDGNEYKDIEGFCKVASIEEVRNQSYILTPGRYVGLVEAEDDGEPFEEKMARLTSELSQLLLESDDITKNMKEHLAKIGYKV